MPCSISLWATSARSIPASNQTGRATRPLRAWSIAMSARRMMSGMRTSAAGAEAMPAKAPTWMIRSSNKKGRATARSTPSAPLRRGGVPSGASASATANSSPLRRPITASASELVEQRVRDRLQQAVAGLIAMLIVDRLEAVAPGTK